MEGEASTELLDQETVANLNEMEVLERILKLRAALKISATCADQAVTGRPSNVSEVVWMAAKLGEIHRFCRDALANDNPVFSSDEVITANEEKTNV